MTVKEFIKSTKLHGNIDIMEIKNPSDSYFIGTEPYKIDNIQDFDFDYYVIRHKLLKEYSNMEIVSMNAGNYDGRCALTIGCKK